MSWARAESNLVMWFTGREQLSELWQNHMQPVKYVTTCKPALAQLNLDSPQGALSNGYRVWGVIMHLGYEGKLLRGSRETIAARGPRRMVRRASRGLVLLTTCSVFVALFSCCSARASRASSARSLPPR